MKDNKRQDAEIRGREEKTIDKPLAPSSPRAFALDSKTENEISLFETRSRLVQAVQFALDSKTENEISRHIVESAIEVHRTLGGPGLLESVYEEALVWELERRNLLVQRQVQIPISYKGQTLASPLRIDLIVGGRVIVECKAVTQYNTIFEAQTLTYLRLTGLKLGLVVNFGERVVKNGVHRVVNGL